MSETNNKSALYFIIGIPLLGLLITTAFYFFVTTQGIQLGTQNNGTLIKPPKQITEMLPLDTQQQPAQWYHGANQWSMVVLGDGRCSAVCQKQLYLVRQIHTMLGSDSVRVNMIYLNSSNEIDEATAALLKKDYVDFKIMLINAEKWRDWLAGVQDANMATANFYLVDPAGWLMMYYTDNQTYKLVIKDLKFLLKNT